MIILIALALLAREEPDQTVTTAPRPHHRERWITYADYPMKARRNRVRGSVEVTLEVNDEGRVTNCNVRKTSQSKLLDRETCRLLLKRARFTPAIGPYGSFNAEYYVTIDWPPKVGR